MINLISAWTNTTLYNGTYNYAENLTFTGNENITRNLSIPSGVKLISGFLNLSGYKDSYFNTDNETIYSEGDCISSGDNCHDNDWSTYCERLNSVCTGNWHTENYTIPEGVTSANFTWKFTNGRYYESCPNPLVHEHIYYFNYTLNNYDNLSNTVGFNDTNVHIETITLPSDALTGNVSIKVEHNIAVCSSTRIAESYYEGAINWTFSNNNCSICPSLNNTYLKLGNSLIWNYTGKFNQSNNRTSNISININNYLSICSYMGGFCQVPFNFHSDTAGILQYSDLFFNGTYNGFIENSQSYSSSAYPNIDESYSINITYDTSLWTSSIGLLNWNNTNYTGSSSTSGNNQIFNETLNIPNLPTGSTIPFYWWIGLTNSSGTYYYKSNNYTQSLLAGTIYSCNDTKNVSYINFTIYNSEDISTRINSKFKTTFTIGNYNFSYENNSELLSSFAFCFEPTYLNYTITSKVEYEATGYAKNYYYLNDLTLTNITTNISLYLLNSTKATVTQLKVQDDTQRALQDVYISIQKYDAGTDTFYTVGMAKTDFNGQDIVYLNFYNTFYRYTLVQNGIVIYSTSTSKIDSSPVIFSVPKNYVAGFREFDDVQYSFSYNNITENFILSYTLASGSQISMCMKVVRRSFSNDTTICNTCETSSSATIYCSISGLQNGTYVAQVYATGSLGFKDILTTFKGAVNTIYDAIGNIDGTIYAIMFGLVILGLFLVSPVMGILGTILGIVGSIALGFQPLNYTELIGIIIMGIVIMIIVKR